MKKLLGITLVAGMVMTLVSCSSSQYGYISRVKTSTKEEKRSETVKQQELTAVAMESEVQPEGTVNTETGLTAETASETLPESGMQAIKPERASAAQKVKAFSTYREVKKALKESKQELKVKTKKPADSQKTQVDINNTIKIGIILLLIGLVVGIIFGWLGYLISVIGVVFIVIGLIEML